MTASGLTAFPADGFTAAWATWDGRPAEQLDLRWENEAWTASSSVATERVEYVVRLSPLWQARQLLLFRDLAEPDLWLGTDGHGHWGEMNGAHRHELEGATDVTLARDGAPCSAFEHTIPIRRFPIDVGGSFDTRVIEVDVETLGIEPLLRTYRKVDVDRWELTQEGDVIEIHVDAYGMPIEIGGRFRRVG